MKGASIGNSQAKQVRWIAQGTSLASGSSYTIPPTRTNDILMFCYTNGGTLSLTVSGLTFSGSNTGGSTGGTAPQPWVTYVTGLASGQTSFTVSGTASGGGYYAVLLISGATSASPSFGFGDTSWSSSGSGGTTTSFNLSSANKTLLVAVSAQFGSNTPNSWTTAGGANMNIRANGNGGRSLTVFTAEDKSKSSTETVTINYPSAQTGGILAYAWLGI